MLKASFPEVQILGREGAPIFDGPLQSLRFPEKLIIEKSVEFFRDPEPCFIHRSAVVSRLVAELDLLLREDPDLSLEALEEKCPAYLGEYAGGRRLRIKKAAG
ncbi:MAG: hypothetical protein LBH26_05425 [Treponema sp.]|jgi:hypothetical protein|nr:hypothetical protein [Treponema sp.]